MNTWEEGFTGGIYVLSEADIKNRNIRFGKARFLFDPTHVGGASEKEPAAKTLEIEFSPGARVERFLFGGKKLMSARRKVTREFFDAIAAKPGDRLLIERTGENQLRISKA